MRDNLKNKANHMQDSTCSRFYASFPDHYCPSIFYCFACKTAAKEGVETNSQEFLAVMLHWQNDTSQSTLKTSVLSTHPSKPRILVNFTNCRLRITSKSTSKFIIKLMSCWKTYLYKLCRSWHTETKKSNATQDSKKKKNRQNLQKHPACMDKGGTSIYVGTNPLSINNMHYSI